MGTVLTSLKASDALTKCCLIMLLNNASNQSIASPYSNRRVLCDMLGVHTIADILLYCTRNPIPLGSNTYSMILSNVGTTPIIPTVGDLRLFITLHSLIYEELLL